MKQTATKTHFLAVMAFMSITIVLFSIGTNAFPVHTQTAGMPLPHFQESTTNAETFARTKHIFKKMRPTTTTAMSAAALPGIGPFAAAAFLPTSLGLWRTGYAVSYGYGGAMLASGLLQLLATIRTASEAILPLQLHAALYIFYGIRLNLFLLHREVVFPVEIHQMKRRNSSLSERLKRLPVVIGCSGLYFCMSAAPMRILSLSNPKDNALTMAILAVGFASFFLAGVGDWYKARMKTRDGPDKLVTTGPFRYLRHPNYTGDVFGWTCVCLLMPLLSAGGSLRRVIPWVLSSIMGWAGICFAVYGGEATAGLEKKQKEKYGGTPEYEEWIKRSWSGPMVGGSD